MAAALPVTKLAGLLVKTFAKPLSKRIKTDLSRFDATKQLLIDIGQANHRVTSYMTIWASGYRVRKISPLEGEKALKGGAEFVGEAFVLAVSAGVVVYEYNRSARSAAAKAEEKRERMRATQDKLQAKLNALDVRIGAVEDLVKRQQELEEGRTLLGRVVPIGGTEKPRYVEPPKEKLVPIADDHQNDDNENHNHNHNGNNDTPAPIQKLKQAASAAECLPKLASISICNDDDKDKNQQQSSSSSSTSSSSWWKFW